MNEAFPFGNKGEPGQRFFGSPLFGPSSVKLRQDAVNEVVRVVGQGLWSDEVLEEHFAELEQTADRIRESGSRLRLLADLRGSGVQGQETTALIRNKLKRINRAGDKMALITESTLHRMQMAREFEFNEMRIFNDESAALAWLRE